MHLGGFLLLSDLEKFERGVFFGKNFSTCWDARTWGERDLTQTMSVHIDCTIRMDVERVSRSHARS